MCSGSIKLQKMEIPKYNTCVNVYFPALKCGTTPLMCRFHIKQTKEGKFSWVVYKRFLFLSLEHLGKKLILKLLVFYSKWCCNPNSTYDSVWESVRTCTKRNNDAKIERLREENSTCVIGVPFELFPTQTGLSNGYKWVSILVAFLSQSVSCCRTNSSLFIFIWIKKAQSSEPAGPQLYFINMHSNIISPVQTKFRCVSLSTP